MQVRAVEGVRYIAEVTRREEDSNKVPGAVQCSAVQYIPFNLVKCAMVKMCVHSALF